MKIILILISILILILFKLEIDQLKPEWISFFGSVLTSIVTLLGVWWQISKEDKAKQYEQKKGLLEYTNFIIQKNHKLKLTEIDIYFYQLITSNETFFIKDEREIYNFSFEFIDRNIEKIFLLDNDNGSILLSFYENLRDFISARSRLIKTNNDKNIEKLILFLKSERFEENSKYGYSFCDNLLSKLKLLTNINSLINLLVLKFDKRCLKVSNDRHIDEIKCILMILEIDNKIDFETIDNLCLKTNISSDEEEICKKVDSIPKELKYSILEELSNLSIKLTFEIGTSSFDNNSIFSNILIGIEDKKFIVNNIQKISKELIDFEKKIKEEIKNLKK